MNYPTNAGVDQSQRLFNGSGMDSQTVSQYMPQSTPSPAFDPLLSHTRPSPPVTPEIMQMIDSLRNGPYKARVGSFFPIRPAMPPTLQNRYQHMNPPNT